jgi:hypothetical protein
MGTSATVAGRLLCRESVAFAVAIRVCALAVLMPLVAGPAFALPDLQPEIYGVRFEAGQTVSPGDVAEGCAGGTENRLLLRFGVRFHNVGPDPLVIGDPGCPECAPNPGAICEDPRFICSPADGHNHPHFIGFANYQLMDPQGNIVREGGKKSFCVRDNRCPDGTRSFDCTNQGISPGCVDDYDPSLGCQYVDATGVADATTRAFRLRATLDPDATLPDGNRGNNSVDVIIPGCGDGVVQDGEECDPASTPVDPCCDAECRLQPEPCEPPPGPCGRPEAPLPDGTPCGPGAPPCTAQVCRSGVCVTAPGSGGCLIGATCVLPGGLDPVDDCQLCDPARRTDTWSRNVDPDPEGLRCQASRLTRALAGNACRPGLAQRLDRCLLRVQRFLDRLEGASPAVVRRLDRRLAREVSHLRRVTRRAERSGCDLGTFARELDVLRSQVGEYRAARRGG